MSTYTFQEQGLEFTFKEVINVKRPRDAYYPKNGWKDVDFIIELKDRFIFLEIKDPDNPIAMNFKEREDFIEALLKGEQDSNFYYKFRDTYLNEHMQGDILKPIHYYILIALSNLNSSQLLTRTTILKKSLPTGIPKTCRWNKALADDCIVFNLSTWNNFFSGKFPVTRITNN